MRDADRIMAAVRDAGVSQIDYLVTTHFHTDHIGAMEEIVRRIPVRHFVDPGRERRAEDQDEPTSFRPEMYPAALRQGHAHHRQAR